MNKYIENFYSLYSTDDRVTYQAILEKKDWMFRPLFFKMDFKGELDENGLMVYPDLFALMDKGIHFKKANFPDILFEEHEDKKELVTKSFNEKYRYRYIYEKINCFDSTPHFFVEMNFNLIDKKSYNELVANFYPCISKVEELDLFYNEESIMDLLKYPMLGENGKWVFILGKDEMVNDRYYMSFIKKIWYNPHLLNQEMIDTLKEISDATEIELEEYYGN